VSQGESPEFKSQYCEKNYFGKGNRIRLIGPGIFITDPWISLKLADRAPLGHFRVYLKMCAVPCRSLRMYWSVSKPTSEITFLRFSFKVLASLLFSLASFTA
jgi:hypothetical protein